MHLVVLFLGAQICFCFLETLSHYSAQEGIELIIFLPHPLSS